MPSEPTKAAELLKRVVIAWDTDDSLDFIAALRASRKLLRLTLTDTREARSDDEVLKANGYPDD
jgi:hypothetical protein